MTTKEKISSLKKIANFVNYDNFKMETNSSFAKLIQPKVYATSTDLKDSFLSVPVP